jgi:trimethylamine--corrinoid protein Co-methyltransferase
MSDSEVATKRRGGRQARRELRAAPPPAEARPVKPGMEGGLYRPLTDTDIERIDRAFPGLWSRTRWPRRGGI